MSQTKTKFIENLAVTNAKIASGVDATKIGTGTVNNTKFGYLANVTSDIQAQINAGTGANNTLTNLNAPTNMNVRLFLNPNPVDGSTGVAQIAVTQAAASTGGGQLLVVGGAAGTGTDIQGGNLVLAAGQARGTGIGNVTVAISPSGNSSGTSFNNRQTVATFSGTLTQSQLQLSPLSGYTGLNLFTDDAEATIKPFTFNRSIQNGTLNLFSGDNAGGGASGAINLKTADTPTAGNTGAIVIASGLPTATGNLSGAVTIQSGNVTNSNGAGPSGNVLVTTGQGLAASTPSGTMTISTGTTTGSSSNSGAIQIISGGTTGSNTGNIRLESANATTSGNSGSITLITGSATGGGSGSVSISTGSGASKGTITLDARGNTNSNYIWLRGAVGVHVVNEASALATTINALDPKGATVYIINQTAATTLNGITAGFDGQLLYLVNYALFNLLISNQSASANAADRIQTQTGGTITSTTASSHLFVYSTTKGCWIYLGGQL